MDNQNSGNINNPPPTTNPNSSVTIPSASQPKKSVFKRWWFWVAVIVILAIGYSGYNASGSKDNSSGSAPTQSTTDTTEPAPTDAVEPTPSETTQTVFKIGDVIEYEDGRVISVTNIERDYQTGNEFVKPNEGLEYIKVNAEVKNTSDSTIDFYSTSWEFIDSKGVIHNTDVLAEVIDGNDPSTKLAAGGSAAFFVVFEIPEGSTGTLVYRPSLFGDDGEFEILVN
jgi:hypothetical protein